jgi:hypothetical protein
MSGEIEDFTLLPGAFCIKPEPEGGFWVLCGQYVISSPPPVMGYCSYQYFDGTSYTSYNGRDDYPVHAIYNGGDPYFSYRSPTVIYPDLKVGKLTIYKNGGVGGNLELGIIGPLPSYSKFRIFEDKIYTDIGKTFLVSDYTEVETPFSESIWAGYPFELDDEGNFYIFTKFRVLKFDPAGVEIWSKNLISSCESGAGTFKIIGDTILVS